jgi:hypothetical protein
MRRNANTLSVALAVTIAVTISACGSTGTPSGTTSSGGNSPVLAYSDCMRSHGVPNFPDPTPGGGIPPISANSGINPFSPAFKAAQTACGKLIAGGQPAPVSAATKAATLARWLRISECMRQHGIQDFPDPTYSMPPSNPDAYSFISDQNGIVVTLPATTNPNSPTFTQAATACNWKLPRLG